ncbi:MAG: hypothetical protein RLZZ171_989 [Cyanobacteriota bacterium]|jgi:hypothetical protein
MNLRSRTPLTAEQISQIIGILCHDLIGTYVYSDGRSRKAVRIGKSDKTSSVSGIEVVINPCPSIRDRNEFWTIFFVDSTNSEHARMRWIVQTLQDNFLQIESLRMLGKNEELSMDDQIVFIVDRGQLEVLREKLIAIS